MGRGQFAAQLGPEGVGLRGRFDWPPRLDPTARCYSPFLKTRRANFRRYGREDGAGHTILLARWTAIRSRIRGLGEVKAGPVGRLPSGPAEATVNMEPRTLARHRGPV